MQKAHGRKKRGTAMKVIKHDLPQFETLEIYPLADVHIGDSLHDRKRLKQFINEVLEKGLKITINTIYGLFNFQYYFLYDPYCTFKVTINNQLWILMLIERLVLAGYTVLSANTDGLLLHIKKDKLEAVRTLS